MLAKPSIAILSSTVRLPSLQNSCLLRSTVVVIHLFEEFVQMLLLIFKELELLFSLKVFHSFAFSIALFNCLDFSFQFNYSVFLLCFLSFKFRDSFFKVSLTMLSLQLLSHGEGDGTKKAVMKI